MGRGDSGSRGRGISRGISRGGAGCASTGPKKESFARVEALGTFKAIQESNRHKVRQAEEQEYLGSPPPDQKFIQVSFLSMMLNVSLTRTIGEPSSAWPASVTPRVG